MKIDLSTIIPQERIEPPEEEILKCAEHYGRRMSTYGYRCIHKESYVSIARYFAKTWLGLQEAEKGWGFFSPPKKGLMLYGPVGTGKTTAMQVFSGVFEIDFVCCDELSQLFGERGEKGFWEYVKSLDGLDIIIDDLAGEREISSFGNASPMIDFIARRERLYIQNKVLTHATTNCLTIEDIGSRYNERISSRIAGMCECVLVDGEDQRLNR